MRRLEIFEPAENEQKIVTLHELIDSERSISEEYRHLIKTQERRDHYRSQNSAFSDAWGLGISSELKDPEDRQWFADHLKNKILIDLGGANGSMCQFSADYGLSTYICVDRFEGALGASKEFNVNESLREIDVVADMLDFLTRIKSRSASITINGIDNFIVDNHAYRTALAEEMLRVVSPGGLIFGANSDPLKILQHRSPPELERKFIKGGGGLVPIYVFERNYKDYTEERLHRREKMKERSLILMDDGCIKTEYPKELFGKFVLTKITLFGLDGNEVEKYWYKGIYKPNFMTDDFCEISYWNETGERIPNL